MRDEPAECDLGDLEVRIFYKSSALKSREAFRYFRYVLGGELTPVQGFRDVPRFTDEHLGSLLDAGHINNEQMKVLLSFSPQTRYLVARSDNPSDHYLEVPNELRELLKRLLRESL
jgi:hypothetical protein